jgi:hypothetical protein
MKNRIADVKESIACRSCVIVRYLFAIFYEAMKIKTWAHKMQLQHCMKSVWIGKPWWLLHICDVSFTNSFMNHKSVQHHKEWNERHMTNKINQASINWAQHVSITHVAAAMSQFEIPADPISVSNSTEHKEHDAAKYCKSISASILTHGDSAESSWSDTDDLLSKVEKVNKQIANHV